MSQGYVPGPCQVFVGTGASAAYEFLGYSESGVEPQFVASYEDIVSDFGGPAVPVDIQFMGEQAFIPFTLNKYNEAVLQKVAARRIGATVEAGAIEANGLGSLMIAEEYAFKLLLYCPYNAKTFQSSSMVKGYEFSAAFLHDNFEVPLSVRLKRPRVILRAVPVWNAVTLTATLYTNTMPSPLPTVD